MRYLQKLMAVMLALCLLTVPGMARGEGTGSDQAAAEPVESAQFMPDVEDAALDAGESPVPSAAEEAPDDSGAAADDEAVADDFETEADGAPEEDAQFLFDASEGELASGAPTTGSDPWGLQVYFLNLGRVDGILICCEGEFGFIDVGYRSDAAPTIAYLKALGVDHLDVYIASHGHADHVGGSSKVIHAFNPKKIYMNRPQTLNAILEPATSEEAKAVKACEAIVVKSGDTFNIGSAHFKCLGPQSILKCSVSDSDENDNSLILRMDYHFHSFLFTGDTMDNCLEAANKVYPGELDVDVLKNPHHNGAHDQHIVNLIKPKITVFCTSSDHSPTREYRRRLKNAGSEIYLTGVSNNGNVAIACNATDMDVWLGYPVKSIQLDPIPDLYVGQTYTAKTTLDPQKYFKTRWMKLKSPNSNVVKVDNCKIKAIGEGKATITATSFNGLTSSVDVNVYSTVVQLEKSELSLVVGEKQKLRGRLMPKKAKGVTGEWISEDESIATCSAKGEITGVSPGTTRIIARLSNGAEAVCTVTVTGKRIKSISLDRKKATMSIGDSLTLTATLKPDDVGEVQLQWVSSDEKILWVDHLGNVTAVGKGTAKIGVRAAGSDKIAVCTIKVE